MNGYISSKQEFLFPDTGLGKMAEQLRLVSASNSKIGIQIMFECKGETGNICLKGDGFDAEYYQLIDIPVEYNTGNGVDQGGAMTLLTDHCPEYAIRQAPFRVYDCLRPLPSGTVKSVGGRVAAYVCVCPKEGTPSGEYDLQLSICADGEEHVCKIRYVVYPVAYDEDRFQQTNWFSLQSMAEKHGLQIGTPAYYEMVRAYARTMRRAHQKTFCIWINQDLSDRLVERPFHFNFEDLKPVIEIFFEEGFDTLETGGILSRGFLPDGTSNMYTNGFTCAAAPHIPVDSDEGYELLSCEMRDFAAFLKRNNWDKKVLFHVMDEPDVHFKTDADLQARRVQYFMTANIVRRYLPNVKIIEAVKSTKFRGAIDIMVPITDGYESNKEAFDTAISLGDDVWTYVCCGPEGKWLNRFLDQPLTNGRLLFWGCALNKISGYLHWGYNQFGCTPDPFTESRGRNNTGIGNDFPCGDAFIVYPGEDGPWLSMRLEAERRGAEEADLLCALRDKDPAALEEIVAQVFRSFDEYDNNPEKLEAVYEQLLKHLC